MTQKIVDLSHTLYDGLITYAGLPAPKIDDHMSREESRAHYGEGTQFQIGKIEMVANTGTYVDVPSHRYEDGKDLSMFELAKLVHLAAIRIDVRDSSQRSIDADRIPNSQLKGSAVLIWTDWSRHWATDQYFEDHPYLTKKAARYLVDQGVSLVGIDSLNIDSTQDPARPVHSLLLKHNIPIVEHLTNLDQVPATQFEFNAAPVKVENMGSFPVRAYARWDSAGEA